MASLLKHEESYKNQEDCNNRSSGVNWLDRRAISAEVEACLALRQMFQFAEDCS